MWHDDNNSKTTKGKIRAKPTLSISSNLPRYVVGFIGSVSRLDSVHHDYDDVDDDNKREKERNRHPQPNFIRFAQHTTFDLGNGGESMLIAQDCRACRPRFHHVAINGCPHSLPTTCNPYHHLHPNSSLLFLSSFLPCWPSHPNDHMPLSHNINLEDKNHTITCLDFGAKDGGYYVYNNVTNNVTLKAHVCTQCFGSSSHSRFFIPQYNDDMVLLDVTADMDYDNLPSISQSYYEDDAANNKKKKKNRVVTHLGKSFQFGAIVGTVPSIDRIWSNIGLGATSTFLKQMNVSSILFHLNLFNDNYSREHDDKIVLNPSTDRYKSAAAAATTSTAQSSKRDNIKGAPYSIENGHRIHSMFGFRFGSSYDDNTNTTFKSTIHSIARNSLKRPPPLKLAEHHNSTHNKYPFHIDSGNNGISIQDAQLAIDLANHTGGEWILGCGYEKEEDCAASTKLFSDDLWEEDGGLKTQLQKSCLAIPAIEEEDLELDTFRRYPDLYVILGHDIELRIPSKGWILGEIQTKEEHNDEENSDHIFDRNSIEEKKRGRKMWTIFNTYHKNVLGLPLLTAPGVDFVFDDIDEMLYVVNTRNNDVDNINDGDQVGPMPPQ